MKPVNWIGSSLKQLRSFPDDVQDAVGHALYIVQMGGKPSTAKPLKGFGGASVLEIVEDHDGDTYRAVYTVKLKAAIYVLHVFQKKSKRGIVTPQLDIELIKSRLAEAIRHAEEGKV